LFKFISLSLLNVPANPLDDFVVYQDWYEKNRLWKALEASFCRKIINFLKKARYFIRDYDKSPH